MVLCAMKYFFLKCYWGWTFFKQIDSLKPKFLSRILDPYTFSYKFSIMELANQGGEKVLDVGSNSQWGRKYFEDNSWVYQGCDLKECSNPQLQDFFVTDEYLPIADQTYDLVISTSVLEHLKNPDLALSEWFRVLKPNGELYIHTNFLYHEHGTPHDYFRFSIYGLEELCNRNGFVIIKLSKVGNRFSYSQMNILGWYIRNLSRPIHFVFKFHRIGRLLSLPLLTLALLVNYTFGLIIFVILYLQYFISLLPLFNANL